MTVPSNTWACHDGVFGLPRPNGEAIGRAKGSLIDCEILTVLVPPWFKLLVSFCYH